MLNIISRASFLIAFLYQTALLCKYIPIDFSTEEFRFTVLFPNSMNVLMQAEAGAGLVLVLV